jgi:phytoene desaturase
MNKRVGVVGAGVGGLATAARLAYLGYDVEVFEKLSHCGGRNNIIEDRGFLFDTGPSFVLMPDFFEEVFSFCGEQLKDYLDFMPLDEHYKIFFHDGSCFTVYRDSEKTKEELEKIEPGSSRAFDAFIAETAGIYDIVRPLMNNCYTKKALINPRYWLLIKKLKALESYWSFAKKFFSSDKLCYAFTFESMFIGVSPFAAPAFYSVITYADHVQKIFHPRGGMYQIPLALEKLCKKFGVRFHFESAVQKIGRTNHSLQLRAAEQDLLYDTIVVNADYPYTQRTLLSRNIPRYDYSCSTYLMYLGLKTKITGLSHHNLLFAQDLKKNVREIFTDKIIPDDPSLYIHVPTVTDPSLAPAGKDIAYLLVPVPNLENPREDFYQHEQRLRKIVFEKIHRMTGISLEELIEVEHTFYPQDFTTRYNLMHGATFGLAHNLLQSAFFRPPNIDTALQGLYYVGGSTQPGGGLPVVLSSSRIVADLITGTTRPIY